MFRVYNNENLLISQIGGESVRIGAIVNKRRVLESYTSSEDGRIRTTLTPIEQYIQEEFYDYGVSEDIDFDKRIEAAKEILPFDITIKEVYADEHINISRTSDARVVITTHEGMEII